MLFFLGYPLIGVSMEIIWLLRNESNADFLKVLWDSVTVNYVMK